MGRGIPLAKVISDAACRPLQAQRFQRQCRCLVIRELCDRRGQEVRSLTLRNRKERIIGDRVPEPIRRRLFSSEPIDMDGDPLGEVGGGVPSRHRCVVTQGLQNAHRKALRVTA